MTAHVLHLARRAAAYAKRLRARIQSFEGRSFHLRVDRWAGFGRTAPDDLFPEVWLGWFRVSWQRADAAADAREWRRLLRDMGL